MSDLVNREDVIKAIHAYWSEKLDDIPVAVCDGYEIYADQKKVNELLLHNKALANRVKQLPSAHPGTDEWCTDCKEYDHEKHNCPRFNRVIRETLTEAEPVKTGKWEPILFGGEAWGIKCSNCNAIDLYGKSAYCPNCGAKMDEGSKE